MYSSFSRELRIPSHISILHVEQEVIGDDTIALQSVLSSDETRENLLKQERELNQQINSTRYSNSTIKYSACDVIYLFFIRKIY